MFSLVVSIRCYYYFIIFAYALNVNQIVSDQTPTKHKIYFCNYSYNYCVYINIYKIHDHIQRFNSVSGSVCMRVCIIHFKWKIASFAVLWNLYMRNRKKSETSTETSICKRLMSNYQLSRPPSRKRNGFSLTEK